MLIFVDTGDHAAMEQALQNPRIAGVTTNPSLLKKAGATDYRQFADEVLLIANGKPVSFEVFADDFKTMEAQAREIASWGTNVFVKIPVTNTQGNPSYDLIWRLSGAGIKVNVTAIFTAEQARTAINSVRGPSIISVFAGRIADTGRDPARIMRSAKAKLWSPEVLLLWASAREIYNVVQAEEAGCDVITLSPELIGKLDGLGRDLTEYSLETVRQFHRDAAGLTL